MGRIRTLNSSANQKCKHASALLWRWEASACIHKSKLAFFKKSKGWLALSCSNSTSACIFQRKCIDLSGGFHRLFISKLFVAPKLWRQLGRVWIEKMGRSKGQIKNHTEQLERFESVVLRTQQTVEIVTFITQFYF